MDQNFRTSFSVADAPAKVMDRISDVASWWATNVTGNTKETGDVFTVRFGKTFSTISVVEMIPEKKLVWLVTDCDLPLFHDPKEWLHSRLVWEVSRESNTTHVHMTHDGLTPGKSCYEDCKRGWTYYVCESLRRMITEGKGMPGSGIFCYAIVHERKYEGLLYFKNDPLPDYPAGFIYTDVLVTRGEQVMKVQAAREYHRERFDAQRLLGEYFMILSNKPVYPNIMPLQDMMLLKNNSKTKNKNYQSTIVVNSSASEAMEKISQVELWWAKNFKGKAEKVNDRFTVDFGETFVAFKISELVPNKKVVWKVTNCNLHWISNKKEWNGTKVVFEISEMENATQIDFTHIGLVPGVECYEDCEVGWNGHVTNSLRKLINEGKGIPE